MHTAHAPPRNTGAIKPMSRIRVVIVIVVVVFFFVVMFLGSGRPFD